MRKNRESAFFDLLDERLDDAANLIKNRVFAEYKDLSWSAEQRKELQPLVRQELDSLIWRILGFFDNVGSVLPDDVEGFSVISKGEGDDIRRANSDYSDMWLEYLLKKRTPVS
jgi:hypothetical protein